MPITVGVDIGGSHISSAAIDMETNAIIEGTYFQGFVNNKASKEAIFITWARVINETLSEVNLNDVEGLSIAMPGPFNYNSGVALFQSNDKYEALHNVSVASELPAYLMMENVEMRFLNDAASFALGSSIHCKSEKVLAITLGTGFGAAFMENHLPTTNEPNVPEGGRLWDKPFKNTIADDYFSTRWFILRYKELTGYDIQGVKEIAEQNTKVTAAIFQEFADNLSEFLLPHLLKFDADVVQLGGSITKAQDLFLPTILKNWKEVNVHVPVNIISSTESANIIGSSRLFDREFWRIIRKNLPSS